LIKHNRGGASSSAKVGEAQSSRINTNKVNQVGIQNIDRTKEQKARFRVYPKP
jgi:hypothetical protein